MYCFTARHPVSTMEHNNEYGSPFFGCTLDDIPIGTIRRIAMKLDIPTTTGANWQDLAEKCGLENDHIKQINYLDKRDCGGSNTCKLFNTLQDEPTNVKTDLPFIIQQLHDLNRMDVVAIFHKSFHDVMRLKRTREQEGKRQEALYNRQRNVPMPCRCGGTVDEPPCYEVSELNLNRPNSSRDNFTNYQETALKASTTTNSTGMSRGRQLQGSGRHVIEDSDDTGDNPRTTSVTNASQPTTVFSSQSEELSLNLTVNDTDTGGDYTDTTAAVTSINNGSPIVPSTDFHIVENPRNGNQLQSRSEPKDGSVFITYDLGVEGKTKITLANIFKYLRTKNIRAYYDQYKLVENLTWNLVYDETRSRYKKASYVIVLITPTYAQGISSPTDFRKGTVLHKTNVSSIYTWLERESHTMQKANRIIPVFADGACMTNLPEFLRKVCASISFKWPGDARGLVNFLNRSISIHT